MNGCQKIPPVDRRFFALLAIAVVLTIVSGTLYGRLTQRWGPPADLLAAADHVRSFPKQLGAWQLLEDSTMPDKTQQILECAGYVNRKYLHQETGQTVGLAIIVGPPGPTAVHTPEICYSSRSHTIKESAHKKLIEGGSHEGDSHEGDRHSFWAVFFESRHAGAQQMHVYYAWNNGQQWEASGNPRIQFGGNRLLYKIQVSGDVSLRSSKEMTDPAWEFVNTLAKSSWSPKTTQFGNQ